MLDGVSDSIQRSRIENHSREVDRQSPTGLIFDFDLRSATLPKSC